MKVRLIKAFNGPRHQRLRKIWKEIAARVDPSIKIQWFKNDDLVYSHAEAFNKIWEIERCEPERYLLLTEEDWLPALNRGPFIWTARSELAGYDAVACQYAKRGITRRIEQWHGVAGGWFILLDKQKVPKTLDFRGEPDPGNNLHKQIKKINVIPGEDAYPTHWGMTWPWGTHLFWARHLHDAPHLRLSGFPLDEIQKKHDLAVDAWVEHQNKELDFPLL